MPAAKHKLKVLPNVFTPSDGTAVISPADAGFKPTGAASFQPKSCDRKLAPVVQVPSRQRPRSVPIGPFVASTYVSMQATCSSSCAFHTGGCFARSGFTRHTTDRQNRAAAGLSSLEVIYEEKNLIERAFGGGPVPQDGARGGRDLRLHVAGDVGGPAGALMLSDAAKSWRARGGGSVWTYTHSWWAIPRPFFGDDVSVLASVEDPVLIEDAREAGYAAAITLPNLPSATMFTLPGTQARIVPCPAETHGRTCAACRLCLDVDLLGLNVAIAFGVHGPQAKLAREALVQIRRRNGATEAA